MADTVSGVDLRPLLIDNNNGHNDIVLMLHLEQAVHLQETENVVETDVKESWLSTNLFDINNNEGDLVPNEYP
tara:strand:+ start:44 stop:262 length:219 start_codon:yes stop_codon:yes gene_type:complete